MIPVHLLGLIWKVHSAIKRSTRQESAVFTLDKKQFDTMKRDERDIMLEICKRSAIQLTKLRHPRILTVHHPLEESRDCMAFATEPIFASLSNVLGNVSNLTNIAQKQLSNHQLHDVEIKCGLLHLAEGISFLHSDGKLLHRNICPDAIVINKEGKWKIHSFEYCCLNDSQDDAKPYWKFQQYNSMYHPLTQPNLEYLAPEHLLLNEHSPASDIYSLAVLIYTIYSVNHKPFRVFGRDVDACKSFANDIKRGKYPNLSCIPNGLSDHVRLMLNGLAEHRPSVYELSKLQFFDNIAVKALCYLDALFQWDNLQKSQFYKKLPDILTQLPHRICIQHVIPCLVKEFLNPQMIPFVLPNVFAIAGKCSRDEYKQYLHEHLKRTMKMDEPWQILLILIKNIEIFLKLASADDIKTDVIPLLNRALESNVQEIQELSLAIVPTFTDFVDNKTIRTGFLPRIKKLSIDSRNVSIKVNCFVCIGKLLPTMDKWIVSDDILPFLTQIKTRDAAVVMSILGILKLVIDNEKIGMTKEVICNKIIPFLMPLCIANDLTLNQFNSLMTLIKKMIEQVDSEQRAKLHQFSSSMQMQSTGNVSNLLTSPSSSSEKSSSSSSPEVDIFGVVSSSSSQLESTLSKATVSSSSAKKENLYTTNMKQLANFDNWTLDTNLNASSIPAPPTIPRAAAGPLVLNQNQKFPNLNYSSNISSSNNNNYQLPSMKQPSSGPTKMPINSMMFNNSKAPTSSSSISNSSSSLLLPMNNQQRNNSNSKLLTKDIKLSDQDILDFLS